MQIRKERDARKRNKQFSSTSDLPLAHMVRSPPPPSPSLCTSSFHLTSEYSREVFLGDYLL